MDFPTSAWVRAGTPLSNNPSAATGRNREAAPQHILKPHHPFSQHLEFK